MQILFYAKDGVGKSLRRAVKNLFSDVEAYRTISSLTNRFRYPLDDLTVAVLVAQTSDELADIVSLRNLLSDVRVILILPNRDPKTVDVGHSLHPRFMSYVDSDFSVVIAVLRKMLRVCNLKSEEMERPPIQ
jgi:hypothetical protein